MSESHPAVSGPSARAKGVPSSPVRAKLARVLRARALMLAMVRADAMRLPDGSGHTRLHALAESALLDAGLEALRAAWPMPPPAPLIYAARPDLAPLDRTQVRLDEALFFIEQHCARAGFEDPEAVAQLVLPLLRRTAAQLNGHLRIEGGAKAWARELRPASRAARDLFAWLSAPAGAATCGAMTQRMEDVLPLEFQGAAAAHVGRSLGELLPRLLARFAAGLEAQIQAPAGPSGRPPTPDALVFGAEGLADIWLHRHPRPPRMRAKVDGFVGWGEVLLRLAVAANDAGEDKGRAGSDILKPTTLTRALHAAVVKVQKSGRERDPHPGDLRPGWSQDSATDTLNVRDLHEAAKAIESHEPGLRRAIGPPKLRRQ